MIRNNRVEEMGAEDPSVARFKCFYVVCVQRMRFRYNFYERKKFSDRSDHSDHMETTFQRSLESGFHMIAATAEKKFSDPSDHSDNMETGLSP